MTENAKRKLADLDNETDAIWRERARLLDDARDVGLALIALAEEALERFPAETKTADVAPAAPWEAGEIDERATRRTPDGSVGHSGSGGWDPALDAWLLTGRRARPRRRA